MNFDAHRPSDRSPIAASSACSCHSSSGIPSISARSATSSQELARALGSTLTRGGAGPSSSTPRRDFVDAIAGRLLRLQLLDLGEDLHVLAEETGDTLQALLGVLRKHLRPERVAKLEKGVEAAHGSSSTLDELCVCKGPIQGSGPHRGLGVTRPPLPREGRRPPDDGRDRLVGLDPVALDAARRTRLRVVSWSLVVRCVRAGLMAWLGIEGDDVVNSIRAGVAAQVTHVGGCEDALDLALLCAGIGALHCSEAACPGLAPVAR